MVCFASAQCMAAVEREIMTRTKAPSRPEGRQKHDIQTPMCRWVIQRTL